MPTNSIEAVFRYLFSYALSAGLRFPSVMESSIVKALLQGVFSLLAPYYDSYGASIGLLGNPRWEVVVDVLPEAPAEILDLATGTADGALQMAAIYPDAHIVGVDISNRILDVARQKIEAAALNNRIEFMNADAAMLPFADASFNLVMTQNAPCHVEEMVRVCRTGGVVTAGWAMATYSIVAASARRRWEVAGLKNVQTRPVGLGIVVCGTVA